ncbi:MAG TPA: hypothetical protein PKA64_10980 [Myxococcota bacterium]|nr:hypothetical protein [Myxococcota bacterium]
MATWTEIQAHMRGRYRLHADDPEVLAMSWTYDDGRSQRIVVRRYEHLGHEMVELKSPFADFGGPDPIELLRENARLAFGAVALSGDVYIVVHNADARLLTVEAFDDLLARVARLADRLESRYGQSDRF